MIATGTLAQATTFATHTALSVWNVANDFLIVLVLFALFFLIARYLGRGPFVSLLVSFYAAYALYIVFPYTSLLPTQPGGPALTAFLAHAGLYAAFVLLFFLILRRAIVSDFLYIGNIGLIILSLLGAAFLVALATHTFSLASVYTLTPALADIFTPDTYFFWWFSAPAAGLLVFAR